MRIHFLGGAGTVTGSKTLIEIKGLKVLLDCGMFQGVKNLRELNRESLIIAPSEIDYVILTHGHLDHCGWLPCLVAQGFSGKIFCSGPTKDIVKLILWDSAKIHEEEAEKANKEKFTKHAPAIPLYTIDEAEKVFPLLKIVKLNEEIFLEEDFVFSFFYASHILGACSVKIKTEGKVLVFSGDLGQKDDPLLYNPLLPKIADFVFLESTYGDRLHPKSSPLDELEMLINNAFYEKGNVIIPSFAVERVQVLMFLLWELKKQNRLPNISFIIDTPMGINVLEIFEKYKEWHKLKGEECVEMCKMFTLITDYKETIETIYDSRPKVVIAASGMITGGRVLSYLEKYIGKPENKIVLVGYQAEGTRGRKLLDGVEEIKIYGKYYSVKASVFLIEGLSAHADQNDLLDWLGDFKHKPKKIFLVHGENHAADELRLKIKEKYGFECKVPFMGQVVEI